MSLDLGSGGVGNLDKSFDEVLVLDFDVVLPEIGGGASGRMIDGIPVGFLKLILDGRFHLFNVFVVFGLILEVQEFL